ncbi:MAG: Flagellar assembly factor FliW [Syntrophomonadaceae bacterium]|nr:Flagellar assembly factor FliW [Bacillota bacterium]
MKLAFNTRAAEAVEVTFPSGLVGFEEVKRYLLAELPGQAHFCRLTAQCGSLTLLLFNPFAAFPAYELALAAHDTAELALPGPQQALVLVTVTIPGDNVRQATVNLAAPLVINAGNRLGRQVVLADGRYRLKEPLFAAAGQARCG